MAGVFRGERGARNLTVHTTDTVSVDDFDEHDHAASLFCSGIRGVLLVFLEVG